MRDGHNGYLPSAGIPAAREAVAADYRGARRRRLARPRAHHDRHVGRHRPRAERAGRRGRRGARPAADVSALHGGAREDRRAAALLPHRSGPRLAARPRSPAQPGHAAHARAGRDRPEQSRPARCIPPATRRALDRVRRGARPDDPGRRGLRRSRLRRAGAAARHARSRRADHLALEPVEGVPRARLARRLDGGGRDAAARRRRSPR